MRVMMKKKGTGVNYISATKTFTILDPNAHGVSGGDDFGQAMSLCDDYMLVGAPAEDDNGYFQVGNSSGKAYLIDLKTYSVVHTFHNPLDAELAETINQRFGGGVILTSEYVVIGAIGFNDNKGRVYIYARTDMSTPLHTIDNPADRRDDQFGSVMAVDGNTIVVGAPGTSFGKYGDSVWVIDIVTGVIQHTLSDPTPSSSNRWFGKAIAIKNNIIAVGVPYEDDAYPNLDSGRVCVFDVQTGDHIANIANPTFVYTSQGDIFGTGVALTDTRLLVGAPGDNIVYIFDVNTFNQVGMIVNPGTVEGGAHSNDYFGSVIVAHNDYAAITSPGDQNNIASGVVHFVRISTETVFDTIINPNEVGTPDADLFGTALQMKDNMVYASAPNEETDGTGPGGVVYVIEMN